MRNISPQQMQLAVFSFIILVIVLFNDIQQTGYRNQILQDKKILAITQKELSDAKEDIRFRQWIDDCRDQNDLDAMRQRWEEEAKEYKK